MRSGPNLTRVFIQVLFSENRAEVFIQALAFAEGSLYVTPALFSGATPVASHRFLLTRCHMRFVSPSSVVSYVTYVIGVCCGGGFPVVVLQGGNSPCEVFSSPLVQGWCCFVEPFFCGMRSSRVTVRAVSRLAHVSCGVASSGSVASSSSVKVVAHYFIAYGERWSRGRAPDCQSRGRWFNSTCRRFET